MKNPTIHVLAAVFLCFCTTKGMVQEIQGTILRPDRTFIPFGLGRVHGTVRDPQGRPLKGVEVRSQQLDLQNSPPFHTLALTDESGGFTTSGEAVVFFEKKGYTPSAIELAHKNESASLSVVLVPESKKRLPKCAGPTDLPSIHVNSLRYSLPPGMSWEKIEDERPNFMICTVWEQECLSIFAVEEYEGSTQQDLRSANSQAGYRLTQQFEAHPELAGLEYVEYSEIVKSTGGRDWTNWNGLDAGKPWRWFKGPSQVAVYDDVSNISARVFDAIIDSACREKDSDKNSHK